MRRGSSLLAVVGATVIALTGPALPVVAQTASEEPAVGAAASPAASASPVASASPGVSPAAGPGSSPAASPQALTSLCEVWTVDEVSAALGGHAVTVDPSMDSPLTCGYQGTATAGSLTESVMAALAFEDESTGPLLEAIRQSFPDAEEFEVGGVPAIPGPSTPGAGQAEGWTAAALFLFPAPTVAVQIQATTPPGVDAEAVLRDLAGLAAPRLANVQPPAPLASPAATSGAVPSESARSGLAALFPADIGGSPVSVEVVLSGPEFLAQVIGFRPMERRVTRALRRGGSRIGDLTFAQGSTASGSAILALQVEGQQIRPFVNVLIEALAMERIDKDVPPEDVAGKDAFTVLSGAEGVAYAKDDVLWIVFSQVPEITEIFEKLP